MFALLGLYKAGAEPANRHKHERWTRYKRLEDWYNRINCLTGIRTSIEGLSLWIDKRCNEEGIPITQVNSAEANSYSASRASCGYASCPTLALPVPVKSSGPSSIRGMSRYYTRLTDGISGSPGCCHKSSSGSNCATIAAREPTPSLAKIRLKCVPTVQELMSSTAAIVLLG
jgi:hypothetical protein